MKYIKYKSGGGSSVISIVVVLIVSLILLSAAVYAIVKWVIPLLKSNVSCESAGGYWFQGKQCPLGENRYNQPQIRGVQGAPGEDYICCFGKEIKSTEQQEETSISSEILSKCKNKLCYSLSNADGYSSMQVMKDYSGGPCLTLYPKDKPDNGNILEKKSITFTSVVKSNCCVMQLGGINTGEQHTYFTGKNPALDFKRVYAQAEENSDYCKVELTVDFANIGSLFNLDNWESSSQDWNNACGTSELLKQPKAMFKLDVMYWDDECTEIINDASLVIKDVDAKGGYSTLIDIKELDQGYVLYQTEEAEEGVEEGVEEEGSQIVFKFLQRKNIGSSSISANDYSGFLNNIYSTSSSNADICEIYCSDDGGNSCKNIKVKYSTDKVDCGKEINYYNNPDMDFSKDKETYKSFSGASSHRYYCIAYSMDGENYEYEEKTSSCSEIYLLKSDKSLPKSSDASCDAGVGFCSDITNGFVCENGYNIFGSQSSGDLIRFYYPGYCDSELFDCYYDTWKEKCFDCTQQTLDCTGYLSSNTCIKNPCGYNGDKGCFWDTEKQECAACTNSCNDYKSEDSCYAHACSGDLKCYWDVTYFLWMSSKKCVSCSCYILDEDDCNDFSGSPCHCVWDSAGEYCSYGEV